MKTKIFTLILLATLVATMALAAAPAKALDYQLYFEAGDQYGNILDAGVYIDGNYVGQTGNSYAVSAGTHSITFDYFATPLEWYTFHYFNGFYYQGDWRDYNAGSSNVISVSSDDTVYASYTTIIC